MDTRQQRNPTVSTDDWYTPKWIIDTLGPCDLEPTRRGGSNHFINAKKLKEAELCQLKSRPVTAQR